MLLREDPALPFNAFGTLAMARGEFEDNNASSQFFFLLKESELTPSGARAGAAAAIHAALRAVSLPWACAGAESEPRPRPPAQGRTSWTGATRCSGTWWRGRRCCATSR